MLKKAHICKKSVVVLYMFQSSGYKLEFSVLRGNTFPRGEGGFFSCPYWAREKDG